jgi:hypothetical protein
MQLSSDQIISGVQGGVANSLKRMVGRSFKDPSNVIESGDFVEQLSPPQSLRCERTRCEKRGKTNLSGMIRRLEDNALPLPTPLPVANLIAGQAVGNTSTSRAGWLRH